MVVEAAIECVQGAWLFESMSEWETNYEDKDTDSDIRSTSGEDHRRHSLVCLVFLVWMIVRVFLSSGVVLPKHRKCNTFNTILLVTEW